jgi:hypothetical protein
MWDSLRQRDSIVFLQIFQFYNLPMLHTGNFNIQFQPVAASSNKNKSNNVNYKTVGYRRVVVSYTYSTPTKVAAVVCSGWAVLGRGPQGIAAGQSGACTVRCRKECRNECICGLDCLLYTLVFGCLTALWLVRISGFMIGWNKRVCDWSE